MVLLINTVLCLTITIMKIKVAYRTIPVVRCAKHILKIRDLWLENYQIFF